MRYKIEYILETDAPEEAVINQMADMAAPGVSQEIVASDGDRAWDAYVSEVKVGRLP